MLYLSFPYRRRLNDFRTDSQRLCFQDWKAEAAALRNKEAFKFEARGVHAIKANDDTGKSTSSSTVDASDEEDQASPEQDAALQEALRRYQVQRSRWALRRRDASSVSALESRSSNPNLASIFFESTMGGLH